MKTRGIIRALSIILAAAALGLLASCPNPTESMAPADATGSVTGLVLSAGGADNAGITVTAELTEGMQSRSVARLISGEGGAGRAIAAQATTDARGAYSLTGLRPGVYTLAASSRDSLERAVTCSVIVNPGAAVEAMLMQLTRTGQISGKVVLSDGEDSLGIVVFIAGTSWSAMTATDGSYTMSYVPAGTGYSLVASKAGYESAIGTASVSVGRTTAAGSMALAPKAAALGTGAITGTAELEGVGSLGIVVYVAGASYSAMSDPTGAFTIGSVPPGSQYLLVANFIGYDPVLVEGVAVSAGQATAVGSLNLAKHVAPVATGSISGSVQMEGAANQGGAFVYLTGSSFITMTDSAGAFSLGAVTPGDWELCASKQGYIDASKAVCVTAGSDADAGMIRLEALPVAQAVTYSVTQAGGAPGTITTTGLSLTFNVDPATLTESNITVTGATMGSLSGSGKTRDLEISEITVADGATVSVAVTSPSGYVITGSPQAAVVYKAPTDVTFISATQYGGVPGTTTTTRLILTFSADPATLTADDVTVTGATKGEFWGGGTTRTFQVFDISVADGAAVAVSIASPAGYSIIGSPKTAVAYSKIAVGEPYMGGIIAYFLQPGDLGYVEGEIHGLIGAATDSGGCWAKIPYAQTLVGTETEIGTGSRNTDKIVALNGAGTDYAAGIARAYNGGGYTDWSLPSIEELRLLRNIKERLGIYGSQISVHWSSSEIMNSTSANEFAWCYDINRDNLSGCQKWAWGWMVLAVRQF